MLCACIWTKDKFDGPVFVRRRRLIFGRKNTSIYNLLIVLVLFLFFQYKVHILAKLRIKLPEYIKE